MEKLKKTIIKRVNEEILSDYNVTLDNFGIADNPNVLAFYSLNNRTISVNINNKLIFNDYIQFIETMLHENVHKINHAKGIEDVDVRDDVQVHTKAFSDTFRDEYGFICDHTQINGSVDMGDYRNQEPFKKLVIKRFSHEKSFKEIRELYLNYIYEFVETFTERKPYQEKKGAYVWEDEDGEEI